MGNTNLKTSYILSCLAIFFVMNTEAICQANTFYHKHDFYEYAVNPATTGRDYYPVVNFSQVKYWLGTKNSPSITSIGGVLRLGTYNFYTPKMLLNKSNLTSKSRMGFGGFIMHEKNGPLSTINSTLNYAYFVPVSQANYELSFGLSARMQYNSLNESILEGNDEGDPELMDISENFLIPDASFGIYFHSDQLFAGASINELFRSKKPLSNTLRNERDVFVHGGYKFFLKRFELEPSAFMGWIDNDIFYYYGRLKMYYLNYNWISVAYRSSPAINVAMGFKIRRFYLAYSYELGISKIVKYFDGAHEIMLGMNIGLYETEGIRKIAK